MKLPKPRYLVSSDERHQYSINSDGVNTIYQEIKDMISVTTALDALAKPALIGWAAREASNFFKTEILRLGKEAFDAITLERIAKDASMAHRKKAQTAADLGTACHAAFEAIIHGREPENLPKELIEPVKAFKEYRLKSGVEIVATEVAVASAQHRFGGRIDFVGYSKERGGFGIGDFKTSSGFYGNEYAYQAGGGYAIAFEEQYGEPIKWAEIVRFSKKEPFESEARLVTSLKDAQQGFLSALAIARSSKLKLIGEPFFVSEGLKKEPIPKKKITSPVGF